MARAVAELTKRAAEMAQPGEVVWDQTVRGFGLRVAPGGTKAFIFRYRTMGGEQRTVTIGRWPALTVQQGREEARKRYAEVRGGGDPMKARKELQSAPTVSGLADHYLGAYAASQRLRAATVRDARDVLRYVLPTLGKVRVAEVGVDDIRQACTLVQTLGSDNAERTNRERQAALVMAEKAVAIAEQEVAAATNAGKRTAALERIHAGCLKRAGDARELSERAAERVAGGRAGVAQANRLRAVLSAMFNLAIQQGTRKDNPCVPVKKLREELRERDLSEVEVGRLLDACGRLAADPETLDPEQAPSISLGEANRWGINAVLILLYTGARLREVLKAEWSHFDLEAGVWIKPSAHTKQDRTHRVELGGPALALLVEMRTRAPHPKLLFPESPRRGLAGGRRAGVPFIATKARADLKGPWQAVLAEAGLSGVRLHDLRHTMASFMLSSGFSLAAVGRTLGHTQASTTQRYARLHDAEQRAALVGVGERMAGLRGATKREPSVVPIRIVR